MQSAIYGIVNLQLIAECVPEFRSTEFSGSSGNIDELFLVYRVQCVYGFLRSPVIVRKCFRLTSKGNQASLALPLDGLAEGHRVILQHSLAIDGLLQLR